MNAPRKTCAECGAELADDAVRGLCPRCLLQAGLGSQTDPDATVAAAGGAGQRRTLPNVGEQFGPYRILRLLGRGGMGVVYEAEEQETGRRVALKVLGRQFDSPQDRARFLREGRLAASINHPNSVYVYGTEEIDGTPTIAMELVSGGTLQERVKNQRPDARARRRGRDPSNHCRPGSGAGDRHLAPRHQAGELLRGRRRHDQDRRLRPFDFHRGAGGNQHHGGRHDGRDAGVLLAGTTPRRGTAVPGRTCIRWAGRCSYLLTGRVPFEGHNIVQLTANVLEKPAPSPRDFRKEIPKGLAGVIQRCLAKQPADRFKSYDDLRQALAPYGSTAPTPATLSLRFLAGMLDMRRHQSSPARR